jgi:murein DD-endopeptidase MepM/ murein hydrolase activator NlpD
MTNKTKSIYTGIYTAVAVVLLCAFGVAILNSGSKPENNMANNDIVDKADEVSPVGKTNVKSLSEVTTAKTTEAATQATTTTPAAKSTVISASEPKQLSLFNDEDEMLWPVSGQIVMDYNTDTAVFDKTLEQYRTNSSISIAAAVGDEVYAAADGQVMSIEKNDNGEVTVTLDNGNGWRTTYSQLRENLAVSDGQAVYKGDVLGYVAQPSTQSSALGSHIDFSVFKDNVSQDPKLVLAQLDE